MPDTTTINNINDQKQKHHSQQQSFCYQQQVQNEQQNSKFRRFLIKPSKNINQYQQEFIHNRKINPIISYMKSFQQNSINFLSDVKVPVSIQVDQQFNSKNYRMIHYNVRISYFLVKIKLFNCIEEDGYNLQFNTQLNHGMFGTVYSIQNPFAKQQQVAIKVIPFNNQPHKIIQNAIKQYALMKILAALQVGPPTIRLFGYDLVTTSNSVMFSMQRGIPLNVWIMDNLQKQRIHEQFQNLQMSLLLLHSLNICHNDIKPSNIIYSNSLRKLIYIDFGFTQVRAESLGYMGICLAKGSLYYCSDQMKNIFLTTGQGYLDSYYNDYICLKKSKQFILSNYLYNQNGVNKSFMVDDHHHHHDIGGNGSNGQGHFQIKGSSMSEIGFFANIMTIYLSHLIQQIDIDQFTAFISQRSWAIPLIQQNMKKVCLFFLQMQPSIGLWQMFNKFTQTFIHENLLLNGQIKRLIQHTLKPYFKQFFSITYPQQQQNKLQINNEINRNSIQFQKKILKRFNKLDTTTILIQRNNINISQYQQQQQQFNDVQQQQQQHQHYQHQHQQQYLDISEQNNQVLQKQFMKLRNLHYYQQKQLTQLLMMVFNRRRYYLITESDLVVLKKCFLLANIRITHNINKQKEQRSLHGIFNKYLILLGKYIRFMHNSFDLKVIFSTTIKYYYQQTPALVQLANQMIYNKKQQLLNQLNDNNNNSNSNNNTKNKQQSQPHHLNHSHNHLQILQMYLYLVQRIFDAYQKNISYKQNITLLQQHIKIFDRNIHQCIQLKNIFLKVDKFKILLYLVNIYLERFVTFTYQAIVHAYILAYHQADYRQYFSLHLYINKLKQQLSLQGYFNNVNTQQQQNKHIHQQINIVQHLDEFINLMTFSDLVPITMTHKYFVVERFQLFIKRARHVQNVIEANQISAVHFNSKLRLFSLYVSHRRIMKAIKLGNSLIQQSLVTTSEICVFIVQSLFRRLNNSKKVKQMTKKVQNLKFSQFVNSDKDLVIENALVLLQSDSKQQVITQKIINYNINNISNINRPLSSLQQYNKNTTYIQNVYQIWQKCINNEKYNNKHTQKLYLLRTIMDKLIQHHLPVREFVKQYYQQVQKYQHYLQTKIKLSLELKIDLYQTKSMKDYTDKKDKDNGQFICKQMLGQFLLLECQQFIKCLMNKHHQILERGLVEESWQWYQGIYQARVKRREESVSVQVKQTHLELQCKFYQHMYCKMYVRQKQQYQYPYQYQQGITIDIKNNIFNNKDQQQHHYQHFKHLFHKSVSQYIQKFNRQLFDHDFYLIILIGLVQQNIKIQQYSNKWARQQIKRYFLFMVQNQQIFYFFYHKSLTKKFLEVLVEIAVEEIGELLVRGQAGGSGKGLQQQQQETQLLVNIQRQHSQQYQQQQQFQDQHKKQQQNPHLLITLIFTQFTQFIHSNQCLSYQQFFIELIILQKLSLHKFIQKQYNMNMNENNNKIKEDKTTINHMISKNNIKGSKQHFIINVINKIRQNLHEYIKNAPNLQDSRILIIILLTFKIDYHLVIQKEELQFISSCLCTLRNHYHNIVRQVYYMLDVQKQTQTQTTEHKNNKSVNKLFRNYKQKNLVIQQSKYLQLNIIKKLKQKFIRKTQNSQIVLMFENKMHKYLENNLGEQVYY